MGIWQIFLWSYVWAFGCYCLMVLACALRRQIEPVLPARHLTLGLIIPAYNEAIHIEFIRMAIAAVQAICATIIVVDDGSTDGSEAELERLCRQYGARLIRHAANCGKAVALNSGLAALNTDIVLTLDADTVVDVANLPTAIASFSEPCIGAVAVRIEGAGETQIARSQAVEYHYVLNFEREALARIGIVFTVPGSASLWRRVALVQIGGFQNRTCAEDTDATISLSLAGWKIVVAPKVRATTQCPASVTALLRQRSRWIWGTIQAAAFAFICLLRCRSSKCRMPAIAFLLVTLLNVIGFLLLAGAAYHVLATHLGRQDVLAAILLVAVTLVRLTVAHWKQGQIAGSILQTLVALTLMQLANAAAFWCGVFTGRATKISW